MSSDDVNDRKQKLNNIILKITEFQLLKLKTASSGGCNREMIDLDQILEQNIETIIEKGLSGGPDFNPEPVGPSAKLPGGKPEPAGPDAYE